MAESTMQSIPSNTPVVHSPSITGAQNSRMSRASQLFVADWKHELWLAGYCYRFHVGTIAAGGDVELKAGGGAGTTIDTDQPEFGIGVPSGYTLIPLRVQIACQVDIDADAEVANILLFADTAKTLQVDGTWTNTVTPTNMLNGATDFPGTARSLATADITDPAMSELLAYRTVRAMDAGTAASQQTVDFQLEYAPEQPPGFAGPCAIYGFWGGTAAVNGFAVVEVAAVPTSAAPRYTRA